MVLSCRDIMYLGGLENKSNEVYYVTQRSEIQFVQDTQMINRRKIDIIIRNRPNQVNSQSKLVI